MNVTYSLPDDIIELLKARADEAGITYSALIAMSLKYTLQKMSAETIREWAKVQTKAAPMTKPEQACLDAFPALELADPGGKAFRFPTDEVAGAAGMRIAEAHIALRKLQKRGLIGVMDLKPGEVDRWGRPIDLAWWLVTSSQRWQARMKK